MRLRVWASVLVVATLVLLAWYTFSAYRSWTQTLPTPETSTSSGSADAPAIGLSNISPEERGDPIALAGRTLTGGDLDLAQWRGEVVVVNVWGSWCTPCREEAPDLARVYRDTRHLPVQFLGIDVRDGLEPARAFVHRYGIGYPSLFDRAGSSLRAFEGVIPVSAVPSTVVLDRAGRVAAANVGKIDARTLRRLVDDVLAEPTTRTALPATGQGGS